MDERSLVTQVLAGEAGAFRLLVERHQRLVMHMITRGVDRPEDREELCQDVFLRVYDKLGEFAFQSKLSTWIATIAYRQAINHLRKQKMKWSEIPEDDQWQQRWGMTDTPADLLEDAQQEDPGLRLFGLDQCEDRLDSGRHLSRVGIPGRVVGADHKHE